MRHSLIHIVLGLLLSVAVTNYLWVDLFDDDKVYAELETEKEQEQSEKELRELRPTAGKDNLLDGGLSFALPPVALFHKIASGYVKHGKSFCPVTEGNRPRLFLLYRQLRLPC